MHHRWILGTLLLLPACAQRYAALASTQTSAAPEESFDCIKKQIAGLGYRQSSIDAAEHRITGTKYDLEARRPDVQFRRVINRLEVEVAPDASGKTSIGVQSHTFAEYTTQRGPTEVEEKAAKEVQEDAGRLLERCGGS